MKNKLLIKLSRFFQIILLLTFLLPFFPNSCEKNFDDFPAEELSFVELQKEQDSLGINNNLELVKNNQIIDTIKANDSVGYETEKNKIDNDLSMKLSNKSPILKIILRPNNNYTGLATLIDNFYVIRYGYGLGITLVLWLIVLIIKFKDFNNIILFINLLGILFLSQSYSLNFFVNESLCGFWISTTLCILILLYDLIIFKIQNTKDKKM
ncbi:MAG: hypothetical protein ACEQSF_01900 [Solirubrobacteraceae bacterium]